MTGERKGTKMPTHRAMIEPCANNPRAWDLDAGDLIQWLAALRTCRESCPLLAACAGLRQQLYPGSGPTGTPRDNPRAVIWAGIAYSDEGRVLTPDSLRNLAARRRGTAACGRGTSIGEGVPRRA